MRLNGTSCINSDKIKWKIHQGVWIDVFPRVPIKGKLDFAFKRKVFSICNFIQMDTFITDYRQDFEELLGKLGYWLVRLFHTIPQKTRIQLHIWIVDRMCRGKGCAYCSESWGNTTTLLPAEVFEGRKQLEFEGKKMYVPAQYEQYLCIEHGNYMELPPEEKRITHGFDIVDLKHGYQQYLNLD